jgi:hypothetical protein
MPNNLGRLSALGSSGAEAVIDAHHAHSHYRNLFSARLVLPLNGLSGQHF